MTTIAYFGCWDAAGHYLWTPERRTMDRHDSNRLRIPTVRDLDGGPLFLPHPEIVGNGSLTYLPAPNLTVLAWWGNNPWDDRPNVNSAVITNGDIGEIAMWKLFTRYFASLAPQLKQPVLMPAGRD